MLSAKCGQTTFCWQHFQMHFLERTILYFASNFTEVKSKGSNWQLVSDLFYDLKSWSPHHMKHVLLHCSVFLKWNKIVGVQADDLVAANFTFLWGIEFCTIFWLQLVFNVVNTMQAAMFHISHSYLVHWTMNLNPKDDAWYTAVFTCPVGLSSLWHILSKSVQRYSQFSNIVACQVSCEVLLSHVCFLRMFDYVVAWSLETLFPWHMCTYR